MTKIENLLKKFLRNPNSLRFSQIEVLLIHVGFRKASVRGSHNKYRHNDFDENLIIPLHGGDCKNIYKIQIAKIIKKF